MVLRRVGLGDYQPNCKMYWKVGLCRSYGFPRIGGERSLFSLPMNSHISAPPV